MKINQKKLIIILCYVMFVGALYLVSATLTRYTTNKKGVASFNIGQTLYFNYERGDLFRNNTLIIGVETETPVMDESGNIIDVERRIETMNVAPGDSLTYHCFISNYNLTTLERNGVDGQFYVSAIAEFTMPSQKANYKLNCLLSYREITDSNGSNPFKNFTSDQDLNLPVYDETKPETKARYEFQITVVLDDQIKSTSADDYIDATLSILLFVDATNDVVVS